ncbi:DNA-binding heavy metal response regulator [Clostridiaceae bacterium JG1575]|nr:DNA-binding heavy metal response regulator [Clostridiaceae bacterium JG1575]
MGTLHIAILEDEPTALRLLQAALKESSAELGLFVQLHPFSGAAPFWLAYEELPLDAVFLDIMMPGESGLEVARTLREKEDPARELELVFLTGTKEYALDGYAVNALGYLVKPFAKDRLKDLLAHIAKKRSTQEPLVVLPTPEGLVRLSPASILYAKARGHQLEVVTHRETITLRMPLRTLEALLPKDSFCLCHRSFLINIRRMERLKRNTVVLEGGCELPVSRASYKEVHGHFIRENSLLGL